MFVYIVIALVGGVFIANQTPINTDLGRIAGSPFWGAAISFLVGTVFLALLVLATGERLLPSLVFIVHQPAWVWLGGVLGVVYLTTNVLLFPRLGALQTVILPIVGLIVMGVVIDTFGWFDSPVIPLSLLRCGGIIVLVAGVVIAVVLANRGGQPVPERSSGKLWLWRAWAVVVGACSGMQQAINGRLGDLLQAPVEASFISFASGTVVIVVIAFAVARRLPFAVRRTAAPEPEPVRGQPQPVVRLKPWNWLGGVLGSLNVLVTVLAVPRIGAGLTIMTGLVGQIVGSVVVQQFGLWRSVRRPIRVLQIIGVLVMLVGVVLVKGSVGI